MRTMLFTTLIALGTVGACDRKNEDRPVVEVNKKTIEPDEPPTPGTTERKDVDVDVNTPNINLEDERSKLSRSIEERTTQLDAKIDALEKRGDEKSKEMAATLRAKRDQARAKLKELGSSTQENWHAFKRDVSDTWDQLEREVSEATR